MNFRVHKAQDGRTEMAPPLLVITKPFSQRRTRSLLDKNQPSDLGSLRRPRRSRWPVRGVLFAFEGPGAEPCDATASITGRLTNAEAVKEASCRPEGATASSCVMLHAVHAKRQANSYAAAQA